MGQLQKKVADRKKISLKDKIVSARKELVEIRANRNKINSLLDQFNTDITFMEKREKYLRDFTKKAIRKTSLEEGDVVEMEVKQIEPAEETEEFNDFDMPEEGGEFEDNMEEEKTEAKEVVKKEMARLKTQLSNLERKLK